MAHISINGLKIIQNTGIKRPNTINYIDETLTSGKSFLKPLGDLSEEISFDSILTSEQLDSNDLIKAHHQAYLNLAEICKKQAVPIIIIDDVSNQNLRFNGRVTHLEWYLSIDGEYEYSWKIKEDADFKAEIKEFNTFNYKAPVVTQAKANPVAKSNAPSFVKKLLSCNPAYNCAKYGVGCVYHLQDLLRLDKFYLQYNRDGQHCTYTRKEFKRWQIKKAKVKGTGKLDTATKNYLKKRFKL